MSDTPDRTRFEELLGLLLDDGLNAEQAAELAHLVEAEPEFSAAFREQLQMDAALTQYESSGHNADAFVRAMAARFEAEQDGEAFVAKVIQSTTQSQATSRDRWFRAPWIVAAMATLAASVLAFWLILHPAPNAPAVAESTEDPLDAGVAVVAALTGEGTSGDKPLALGSSVGRGTLILKSGYLELDFYRGAHVTIGGPAELELQSTESAICRRGKIRAQVPVVARGFTIVTPHSQLVDLGTEFGLDVMDDGHTEVHVFQGEVEAYAANRTPDSRRLLKAGQALQMASQGDWREIAAQEDRFSDLAGVNELAEQQLAARGQAWQKLHAQLIEDERLIAYYDFEPAEDRILRNRAFSGRILDGACIGTQLAAGPWPGKSALEFKRPGDRVRVQIPGEFTAMTLAAWVRVDSLERKFSSLLLTDGWDAGEIHWQFRPAGTVGIGLHGEKRGRDYVSPPVVDPGRFGRWFHLASAVDLTAKRVAHFVDGQLVSSHKMQDPPLALRLGAAAIGNWEQPRRGDATPIRNLNGRLAELMLFKVALSDEEIARFALRNPLAE